MDYKESIRALRNFKSTVSAGSTSDGVSSLSDAVCGWEGNANTKFESYIETVKKDASQISKRKTEFLSEIDGIISDIQAQFDLEYQLNSLYLYMNYDEDPVKNRNKKYQVINSLSIDKSVKQALLAKI